MLSQTFKIKTALYINYFVFAILLNSVGIVILKAQENYGVDEVQASILELFKDLPIAIVSFLVASFLPRLGYKKAMLIGLGIVTFAALGMYAGNSFLSAKMLFLCVGAAFALIKVSVYATIGLVTSNESEHNSLMSNIEGFFMFGITFAYFLFPAFNTEGTANDWLNVYLLIALLCALSFAFLWTADFDETQEIAGVDLKDDFSQMLKLMSKLLVLVFVFSAFLFVMVEQGIMTWLPTFNKRVFDIPENVAIMMTAVLFIAMGVGRMLAGLLVKRINWFPLLVVCLLLAMATVLFVLPEAINSKIVGVTSLWEMPLLGFAFPIVGLFLAPIYPLINSTVLSALPKKLHSQMTGLIIIFSAIGGTLGSRLIGYLFKNVGAESAFSYTLIPMGILLIALFALYRLTRKPQAI
ncbi:MAG: FHS family glucose/mannose:H+ symporter-like MFS transporter [Polaribacter sp.]|jgi:FHS family glucose/mannose:H+ symporter-like MFS transporter